jgi:hypothetical protein
MAQVRSWAGLDVHAAKVIAATIAGESGELRFQRLSGATREVVAFCAGLPGPAATRIPAYQPDRASRTPAGPAASQTNKKAPRPGAFRAARLTNTTSISAVSPQQVVQAGNGCSSAEGLLWAVMVVGVQPAVNGESRSW